MEKAKARRPLEININAAGKIKVRPDRDSKVELSKEAPELKMLDLGTAYRVGEEAALACFRCYCGSGCLCGCVN